MRVLFATSEVVPFSKTGGLADVSNALPRALAELGVEVHIFTPLYRKAKDEFKTIDTGLKVEFSVFRRRQRAYLRRSKLPNSPVEVFFVEHDGYFYRPGLYGDDRGPYRDNSERFIFFCRAILELSKALGHRYDIIHSNEWQTAMLPVYLKTIYADDEHWTETASVQALHNLAYQGVFNQWDFNFTGLDWDYFSWRYLEFWGKLNLLKGGIVFADKLVTVSPTYAKEIQSDPEFGCGLETLLKSRSEDLVGILNGCDYTVWNPETDKLIPANYSEREMTGKALCKEKLQEECGFERSKDVFLVGIVTRLAEQKGLDILLPALNEMLDMGLQFVVLGTGEKRYEAALKETARKRPDRMRAFIKFDERLAHLIEAGADAFLMPSRYEPCGLNQMYSMRYGTIPIVRKTGGLADTVCDFTRETLKSGEATGFVFSEYKPGALLSAVKRAYSVFTEARSDWMELVKNAMRKRFTWDKSAPQYLHLYESAIAKRKGEAR